MLPAGPGDSNRAHNALHACVAHGCGRVRTQVGASLSSQALQRWRRIMKRRQERKKLLEDAERRRVSRMERTYGVKSSTLPQARSALCMTLGVGFSAHARHVWRQVRYSSSLSGDTELRVPPLAFSKGRLRGRIMLRPIAMR